MPTSDAQNKADRLYMLQKLFEVPGQRLRTREIAERLGMSEDTIKRDIDELDVSRRLPLRKDGQFWILAEDARLEKLHLWLNQPEAAVLYLSGRMFAQIQDEQNRYTLTALTALVDALPEQLRAHQHKLVQMTQQRQRNQRNMSPIFEALALGWANRRKVRLLYAPPRKKKFECLFSPYLLEPSGIGRTIYAIGESTPPGGLRTYKLERIEYAQLTEEAFAVADDFDGPALLTKAWGVMYGDGDLVEVRLRFSHYVTQRVRETLWHPSQTITDTPEGCEWTAYIGDTLEIENWIRGWGSDCEVLTPAELRENIIADVRRSARKYGIAAQQPISPDNANDSLLDSFFGE